MMDNTDLKDGQATPKLLVFVIYITPFGLKRLKLKKLNWPFIIYGLNLENFPTIDDVKFCRDIFQTLIYLCHFRLNYLWS